MRGRPFQKGEDERRNLNGRGPSLPSSMRRLAREDRENTFQRLAALRDQRKDLRIALEAAKVLAAYSDGAPGEGNVPEEEPEDSMEPEERARVLAMIQPPGLNRP
jgi:hypothetical protein